MSANQINIPHPVNVSEIAKIDDPSGYAFSPKYGVVTHDNVPPGTVIIWPQDGAAPLVLNTDQLAGKLATELFQQKATPPTLSINNAVMASIDAMEMSYKKVWHETAFGTPVAIPPPAPEIDFIDSSNPFAKVLDAWQTGKAGWTKSALHIGPPFTNQGAST